MPEIGTINYVTEYEQALAQAYPNVLHFGALYATPNNGRYRWVNGRTIEIPILKTTGRVDADRDEIGFAKRNHSNAWETKTLARQRSWETIVHPKDIDQTNAVVTLNNIVGVYNSEQKFPEMDAYTVSKLYADWSGQSMEADTMALTEENILDVIDGMYMNQTEHRVTPNGRILYVTPFVHRLIKNAQKISRHLDVTSNSGRLNRVINAIDNVTIEEVPSDLMMTAYDFTEGWAVGATAKQINMLMIDPMAVITPVSYDYAQIDPPSAGSKGKYVYYEESHEDAFILNNKKWGLQFHTAA